MAASLVSRRSFLVLCTLVSVYLFSTLLHSRVPLIEAWRRPQLSPYAPSRPSKAFTFPSNDEPPADQQASSPLSSPKTTNGNGHEATSAVESDEPFDSAPPSSAKASTPHKSSSDPSYYSDPSTFSGEEPAGSAKPCSLLPGAEDVMVVMKTGESEIRTKLPVHFETTFACAHHYAIFSDMERDFDGYHVEDILAGVPEQVRMSNPEFDYYNKVHEMSRDGATDFSPLYNGASIKEENPAWVLDKWKFLPSLERAYELKSDAKWYLFIEADAAVVWWNLLGWLSNFDPSEPYYLGGEAWVAETMFAHGGAGYVLSNAALKRVVEALKTDDKRYERVVQECCGDLVTAVALRDLIDLKLQTAWPITQGETPTTLDYTSVHWCHPAVTYHHMNATLTQEMWDFEQKWRHTHSGAGSIASPIMHGTAFEHFVWPYIQSERDNWDNLSRDMEITPDSDKTNGFGMWDKAFDNAAECRDACLSVGECMQWSWEPGMCKLSWVTRLGDQTRMQRSPGLAMRSGWMTDRIQAMKDELADCEPIWITEQVD